jgi:hypothetical protein
VFCLSLDIPKWFRRCEEEPSRKIQELGALYTFVRVWSRMKVPCRFFGTNDDMLDGRDAWIR